MPLLPDIDILPAEYPLFEWADWPESRAALVKDGPTSAFQMACWNAIVTHLSEALTAAGIEWDMGPGIEGNYRYTVEDTLITDGFLNDYQFNRMVDNIYERVPLNNWLWATDKSYRGYIGRIYVYQYPVITPPPGVPNLQDIVYPEYFTELVYRLNQFIEIMRGTWPMIQISASTKSKIYSKRDLMVRQSIPIAPRVLTNSAFIETPLEVLPSIPIIVNRNSPVPISADITQTMAAPVSVMWQESRITTRFDGEVIRAGWVDLKPGEISTVVKSLVECLVMMETGARHLGHTREEARLVQQPSAVMEAVLKLGSWFQTGISQRSSLPAAARVAAMSRNSAAAAILPSSVTEARERTNSAQQAEISPAQVQDLQVPQKGKSETIANVGRFQGAAASAEAKTALTIQPGLQQRREMRLSANQTSGISRELSIVKGRPRPAWAEKITETSANITPETTPSASVGTAQNSEIRLGCTIGTAWEPPIWHDGGLWIRQVRNAKLLPDGSLDLTSTGDPISTAQRSRVSRTAVLDTAWLPPIWVDGGLYIRQIRHGQVLEDGSLDITGSGDEFAVAQSSMTGTRCALDTAWEPPVFENGGLYLRQCYGAVLNENGELEVI